MDRPDKILHAVKRPRGGVNAKHLKITREKPVVRITAPEKVVIPMSQHIGAPCVPTVKVGDHVDIGQLIGDSDKFVSAPVHASVSGKVTAIGDVKNCAGQTVQAVTIENDGLGTVWAGIEPPKVDTKEDLIKAVRASGLVGMGGAGFPTSVKLSYKPEQNVDTLIVNAAECEPYIAVDYRECVDNSWDVLSGVYDLVDILHLDRVIIATEDDKSDALGILKNIADKDNNSDKNVVRLMALKAKYPQGAEKLMIQSATGRQVPAGKLPADVGCVVMNVASVAFLARYLKTGKPLVSRNATVSGDDIKEPNNVRFPIGTSVRDLVNFCGGFEEEPGKLIVGGPMMGFSIYDEDIPMLKNNNAVLAFKKSSKLIKKETACIHCGRCADACPMSLIPTDLEKLAKKGDAKGLSENGIMTCMECGSCAYSCPAGQPLVQYMKLGKSIVKKAGAK